MYTAMCCCRYACARSASGTPCQPTATCVLLCGPVHAGVALPIARPCIIFLTPVLNVRSGENQWSGVGVAPPLADPPDDGVASFAAGGDAPAEAGLCAAPGAATSTLSSVLRRGE